MISPKLAPLTELPLQWELFHTQADQHLAQVYVRLRSEAALQPYWEAGWRIEGDLYGPHCSRSHTLPAHYRLSDQGSGPTLLARAPLPDPCFWSAEIPALYQVTLHLCKDGAIQLQQETSFGLRSISVQNQQIKLAAEPAALQAIHIDKLQDWSADACREQSMALIIDQPDKALLQQASQLGVWIIAILSGDEAEIFQQLSQLVSSPAVCIGIIRGTVNDSQRLRDIAPNLLLGQWIDKPSDLPASDWSQLLFCEFTSTDHFSNYSEGCSVPIVAVRSTHGSHAVKEAVAACQQLKKELIPVEQLAGYAII